AEGMFFGCIPIATSVSCVSWMLGGGSRGILISEGKGFHWNRAVRGERKEDIKYVLEGVNRKRRQIDGDDVLNETVDKIIELLEKPDEMKRMSQEAQNWSQKYTLEKFAEELRLLLKV